MFTMKRLLVHLILLLALLGSISAAQIAGATALSAVALTTDKTSPQSYNTVITLTATPTGGNNLEYKFYVGYYNNYRTGQWEWTWSTLHNYSAANTCPWQAAQLGSYWLRVLVREVGSPNAYDKAADLYFTIAIPLQQVSLGVAGDSYLNTATTNTPLSIGCYASGGYNLEYKFYVARLVGSSWKWTVQQDYSASKTCPWTPTIAGSYWLRVLVREVGSPNVYDKADDVDFTVMDALSSVSLTVNKTSPQSTGTAMTLTATPAGAHGTIEYKFYVARLVDSTWKWTVLRIYSTSTTCPWTPTVAGSYCLRVLARKVGSAAAYDKLADRYFTVNESLASVALEANLPSPQPAKTALTLTATPTGSGTIEYKFYVARQVGSAWDWTVLQNYNAANTCPWTPALPGNYWLRVLARRVGSTTTYDKAADLYYTITDPLPKVTLEADIQQIQLGNSVVLTWSSTDATEVVTSNFGAATTSGSVTLTPDVTTTYTITLSGPGGQATTQVEVQVIQ